MCGHKCRSKRMCKHLCCKEADQLDLQQCRARVVLLLEVGDYSAALEHERQLADRWHEEFELLSILECMDREGVAVPALRPEEEASDAFLLGYAMFYGVAGHREDKETAVTTWFQRAADAGHVLALELLGLSYRDGVGLGGKRDAAKALACFQRSARQGCAWGAYWAGVCYEDGEGTPVDLHCAASYFQAGSALHNEDCADALLSLKRREPLEIAPWGRWRPDPLVHSLVPLDVRQWMRLWMLVASRLRVSRFVALLVASFICTR